MRDIEFRGNFLWLIVSISYQWKCKEEICEIRQRKRKRRRQKIKKKQERRQKSGKEMDENGSRECEVVMGHFRSRSSDRAYSLVISFSLFLFTSTARSVVLITVRRHRSSLIIPLSLALCKTCILFYDQRIQIYLKIPQQN